MKRLHPRLSGGLKGRRFPVEPVIMLVAIIAVIVGSIYGISPPNSVSEDAPLTTFSSGRAMVRLREMARHPNPIGTEENANMRQYLIGQLEGLGLQPEVQTTSVVGNSWRNAATVENLMARISGTDNSQAIMLVAHYDTVPFAPGASDNKAGVSAILETTRAILAGEQLKNDLIILFTDGEEIGLLGALAFVDQHPWAQEIGLVLNLEARGTSGPVLMFETSDNNGWLIEQFARAATNPIANSVFYELYKRMPNGTDLSEFKRAGLAGLNFAFVESPTHYHTALDNMDSLDERSLQHQGTYLVSLTKHFGNLDLTQNEQANQVYFDVVGKFFVHYPESWVWPFTVLILLAFLVSLGRGVQSGKVALKHVFYGFFVNLGIATVVTVIVGYLGTIANGSHEMYMFIPPYNALWYLALAVIFASILAVSLLFKGLSKIGMLGMAFGGQLIWVILTLVTSAFVPGASYLFAWPLLTSILGASILMSWEERSLKRLLLLLVTAIPVLVFWAAFIRMVFIAMGLFLLGAVIFMVALVLLLLIPQLDVVKLAPKRLLFAGASVLLVGCIAVVMSTSNVGPLQPVMNTIVYVADADTGEAVWTSVDGEPDEFTSQFLGENYSTDSFRRFLPYENVQIIHSPAPFVPLDPVTVEIVSDTASNSKRVLHLRVVPRRRLASLTVFIDPEAVIGEVLVEEKPVVWSNYNPTVHYYAPPLEGIELVVTTHLSEEFEMITVEQTYDLPSVGRPIKNRPSTMIPAPTLTDSTLVKKTFTF